MVVANPNLIKEIKTHSKQNFNIDACFNCGTCTAICPLSTEEYQFPRAMIRYGVVGQKQKLLSEKRLWMCSACNDCSESCPRNATPGEYMNAVRKWAITQYDVSRISRLLFRNKWNFKIASVLVAFFFGALFLAVSDFNINFDARPIAIFDFFPYEFIHYFSIGVFAIVGLIAGLSLLNQGIKIFKAENDNIRQGITDARQNKEALTVFHLIFSPILMIKEAFSVLIFEVFGQKRQYECLTEKKTSTLSKINSKWMYHVFTIWGFIGLFLATVLDMFLKPNHNEIPQLGNVLFGIRLLGIISGTFFVIGVSAFILMRLFKVNKYYSNSTFEDYFILVTLWIIGVSGVLLTATLYWNFIPAPFAYAFFIIHITAFFELMVFAPFTKFAHVWYRTFAFWIYYGVEKRKSKVAS